MLRMSRPKAISLPRVVRQQCSLGCRLCNYLAVDAETFVHEYSGQCTNMHVVK